MSILPMFYPADYGFIDETLSGDGDPIDILVLTTYPTFPGCVIRARVVGMFLMTDDKGRDEKLIAVPVTDPRFEHVHSLGDLSSHLEKNLTTSSTNTKDLKKKKLQ